MLEKLKEIDTKAIKSLVKLKQDKSQIKGFLDKASQMREKVDKSVFERVKGDYESRHAELDMQSIPLKDEARTQYRKFIEICHQIEAAFEEARIDKEELEFRHAVGEVTDKDLQAKLKEAEKALADRKTELAEAEMLKKQFVEAFDSESELEEGEASGEFESGEFDSGATSGVGGAAPRSHRSESDLEKTRLVSFDPQLETRERSAYETFILPEACLIAIEEDGGEGKEYTLGAFNYIGRTEENQIRLTLPGISRKHAFLKAGPEGFVLKDLESHNGTFVNDERIEERILEDGDLIALGNVKMLFRVLGSSAQSSEG